MNEPLRGQTTAYRIKALEEHHMGMAAETKTEDPVCVSSPRNTWGECGGGGEGHWVKQSREMLSKGERGRQDLCSQSPGPRH